jgi:hypothetical protein
MKLQGIYFANNYFGDEELLWQEIEHKFSPQPISLLLRTRYGGEVVVETYRDAFNIPTSAQYLPLKTKNAGKVNSKAKTAVGKKDGAMKGGIDLTSNKFLQTQNAGLDIKFDLDPAMLEQLKNSLGFTPVIINIQPLTDLRVFLGIN